MGLKYESEKTRNLGRAKVWNLERDLGSESYATVYLAFVGIKKVLGIVDKLSPLRKESVKLNIMKIVINK